MSQDPAARLYVASHLRHVWTDDRVVILDLRSESYFALDPVASLMWREFTLGHDRAERSRNLQDQFPGEDAQLKLDLDGIESKWIESGWLVDADSPPTSAEKVAVQHRPAERFLSLRAWMRLFRITLLLSSRGFGWTYGSVLQEVRSYAIRTQDQDRFLRVAVSAFARAEEFFNLKMAPADCLPRSLALFHFLRRVGLPVEHCIGVQQFPFAAHAWTEFRGRVVHDDPENLERYTPIARITE